MVTDIVTQLRELGRYVNTEGGRWFEPITTEAADEIERLRAEIKRWRNWTEEYFYTDPDCECPLCDQVKAAINGDR